MPPIVPYVSAYLVQVTAMQQSSFSYLWKIQVQEKLYRVIVGNHRPLFVADDLGWNKKQLAQNSGTYGDQNFTGRVTRDPKTPMLEKAVARLMDVYGFMVDPVQRRLLLEFLNISSPELQKTIYKREEAYRALVAAPHGASLNV